MKIAGLLNGYAGKRFGERITSGEYAIGNNGTKMLRCVCHHEHESWVRLSHLNAGTGGRCKKCHCKRIATRHGEAGSDISKSSPAYKAWVNMISRSRNDESYCRRGIKVCQRWKIFENFKSDMGEPPDRRMQLDRKDGTKGYSPDNCRWRTRAQNNKNRLNLRMVSFSGMTMCVADWEKYLNVTPDKLRKKLRFKRPLETIMAELGFKPL